MTDRYEEIRKALEMGPTPGPWKAYDPSESGWIDITNAPYATPLCYAVPCSDYLYDAELDCKRLVSRAHETPANAAHISACDPDTIRELLAERDQLAAALEAERVDACVALVADIRLACGDNGKRMQPELVEYIRGLARDAARYRLLRRKICIAGGEFHILNLDPRYIAPDAAVELDAAIDAAMQRTSGGDHADS